MKRLLSILLVLCLIMIFTGCGNIFIRGAVPVSFSTVSGLVSVVELSTVIGNNGTTVEVTFVTLLQTGTSSLIAFCGDQRGHFPIEQTVRADFNPGQTCASIVTIVIV